MGQISENSTFDAAVYQWETTDSVTGGPDGIANAPLKNLANRTRFLNDKLTLLQAQIVPLAPINSPNFTGSPTVPTPSLAAKGNEVATASLARAFSSGLIGIPMTSVYQLSSIEAGNASFIVVGNLAATGLLLLPTNAIGRWSIYNSTNAKIVVRLSQGGNGVTIAAGGCSQTIIANGTDCFPAHNDYTDANLQGSPIAPAPTLDDNSSRVANTYWVNARIAQEAYARSLADQSIRADVAAGYALQTALASEAQTRLAQDTNEANLRWSADVEETKQRIASDTQIRTDLGGYATKVLLQGEADTRYQQDTLIRTDSEAAYIRKGQTQGGGGHVNFVPGDGFDVPVSVNLTTGTMGGVLFVTSSLIMTYQVPNGVTLDVYVGSKNTNSETTYQTMPVQTSQYIQPNTSLTISAHARTSYGGGWCQMALALAFIFVPNG